MLKPQIYPISTGRLTIIFSHLWSSMHCRVRAMGNRKYHLKPAVPSSLFAFSISLLRVWDWGPQKLEAFGHLKSRINSENANLEMSLQRRWRGKSPTLGIYCFSLPLHPYLHLLQHVYNTFQQGVLNYLIKWGVKASREANAVAISPEVKPIEETWKAHLLSFVPGCRDSRFEWLFLTVTCS